MTTEERYTLQPIDMTDEEIIDMYRKQGWPVDHKDFLMFNPMTNFDRRCAEQFRVNCGWRLIGCETLEEQQDRLEDEAERAEEQENWERHYGNTQRYYNRNNN